MNHSKIKYNCILPHCTSHLSLKLLLLCRKRPGLNRCLKLLDFPRNKINSNSDFTNHNNLLNLQTLFHRSTLSNFSPEPTLCKNGCLNLKINLCYLHFICRPLNHCRIFLDHRARNNSRRQHLTENCCKLLLEYQNMIWF